MLGGLTGWHLTLPTGPSEAATEVAAAGLGQYADAYFAVGDDGDRVRFVNLFGGARSDERTAFSRCELRQEFAGAGATPSQGWPCATSVRSLHVELRIVQSPLAKPEMSVARIQGAERDVLDVRYVGPEDKNGVGRGDGIHDTGHIEVTFNDGKSNSVLDDGYVLGDVLTLDIETDGAGTMHVTYVNQRMNSTAEASETIASKASGGCYFTAGNFHRACSLTDINGQHNAACAAKKWPAAAYERDPHGQSQVELMQLSAR